MGVIPVCVCALFMGHIGYISLKTKNIFFFIIKVFAKTRNYKKKKKKSVSAVHSEAQMFFFSASCRLLTPPHVGKLYPGGSFMDLQPEGRASRHTTGHFWTSGFGVRVQAGARRISRNRDTHLKFGTKS